MKANNKDPSSSPEAASCRWCEGPDLHAHLYDRTGRLLTSAPILTLWQANKILVKSGARVNAAEREGLLLLVKARLLMGSPHDPRNIAHDILARSAHGDA